MKKILILTILFILVIARFVSSQGMGNIRDTRHNLAFNATLSEITAADPTVTRVCVFCHTPHHSLSDGPLWNHTLSTRSNYTIPSEPTMISQPLNPPDGDSRLCLSCHDGDQPVGSVVNYGGRPTTITMTGPRLTGDGRLDSPPMTTGDLSGHHPVSIEITDGLAQCKSIHTTKGCGGAVEWYVRSYTTIDGTNPELLKPTTNNLSLSAEADCTGVPDDTTGQGVQCSSCHDAHYDPTPGVTKFLRIVGGAPSYPGNFDGICCACHLRCIDDTCP